MHAFSTYLSAPFLPPNPEKKHVLLLGDGFLARGFLQYIDRKKYTVEQLYKNQFINPQDVLYSFEAGRQYTGAYHLRDGFKVDRSERVDIQSLTLEHGNKVCLNEKAYTFDYLIIGLGAAKTLQTWTDEINSLADARNTSIGIVGMGPVGLDLGLILSSRTGPNRITLFDMLPASEVFRYSAVPEIIQNRLKETGITPLFQEKYDPGKYAFDRVLFAVGNRRHALTETMKADSYLRHEKYKSVYLGGDCLKVQTAQAAYDQGKYIAEQLNSTPSAPSASTWQKPYHPVDKGSALHIGAGKILVGNHRVIPDGVYPSFLLKLYSFFFI